MDQTFVNDLPISKVSQQDSSFGRINIQFRLNEDIYYLVVLKDDAGIFKPVAVRHFFEEKCSFCGCENLDYDECHAFASDLKHLFHRLIQFPSVRLEWLFIEHT